MGGRFEIKKMVEAVDPEAKEPVPSEQVSDKEVRFYFLVNSLMSRVPI